MTSTEVGTPVWLSTKQANRRISDIWRGSEALVQWLNANVGPSHVAAEEPR
jgi:hypothetical protein